jgi:hypothetical protein
MSSDEGDDFRIVIVMRTLFAPPPHLRVDDGGQIARHSRDPRYVMPGAIW